MANKTGPGSQTFDDFAAAIEPASRRAEAVALDALYRQVTGYAPVIWGGAMVGYGRYAYRYASGHGGEALAAGFAPRKADLVIYGLPDPAAVADLLSGLGPHRSGKACLYLRRLDGVDLAVLGRLIRAGLDDLATRWTIRP